MLAKRERERTGQENRKTRKVKEEERFCLHYQVIGSSQKDWWQNWVENLYFDVNTAFGLIGLKDGAIDYRFSAIFDEFQR